jgi:hypothetical protein
MAPINILGMPPEGNPSFLLCTVHSPWPSSGGLGLRRVVRSREPGWAAPMPPPVWPAPCRPHVPHAVLPPSRFFLRPQLLTRYAR